MMDVIHAELLRDLGFTIDPEDIRLPPAPPNSPTLPDRPHHYDHNGQAVFTSEQVAWADPNQFGFQEDFLVVEEEETSHPWALNYADECNLPRKRPVHRYSRAERFKFILGQLMGCSGNVPHYVLAVFQPDQLAALPPERLWDEVRSILKTHKWRIYYNRIPAILAGLGLSQFKFSDTKKFQDILDDFGRLDSIFDLIKPELERTYFPNLRFVAIKLMERHGVHPLYPIPKARTFRKLQALDELYKYLWYRYESKQINDFIDSLQ